MSAAVEVGVPESKHDDDDSEKKNDVWERKGFKYRVGKLSKEKGE